MIVAVAESPSVVNRAVCPLLFWMVAVREKISSSSRQRSEIRGMLQSVDVAPGALPAEKVTVHVVPV